MPVGLVPVNIAVLLADLHVDRPAHRAAKLDPGGLDAPEDRVELILLDAKAQTIDRKILVRIDASVHR